MLFLALSLVFFCVTFFGIGFLLSWTFKQEYKNKNPFIFLFLGYFYASVLGILISFVYPVNLVVQLAAITLGMIGFFLYVKKATFRSSLYFWFFFLFLFLLFAYFQSYAVYPYNSDTDTYHSNAVTWLNEYGTVVGLANLFERFGVNTSWHVLAAIIDNGLWDARAVWLMPVLAYTAASAYFLWEIFLGRRVWQKLVGFSILAWTFCNVLTWGFPSLHYDFIALLFNAVLVHETLLFFQEDKGEIVKKLSLLLTLSIASFIIKPMGAFSVLAVFTLICIILKKERLVSLSNLLKIGAIPSIALATWMSRSVILSGWPLFPSMLFPMPVDWLVPVASVKHTFEDVLFWARRPLPDYLEVGKHGFLFWFIPWVKISLSSIRFWFVGLIPFVIGLFFWAHVLLRKRSSERLFFFIWSMGALFYWFLLAPDIRFGDGLFFVFLNTGMAYYFIQRESLAWFTANSIKYLLVSMIFLFSLAILATLVKGKRGPVNFLTIGRHTHGPIVFKPVDESDPNSMKVWTPVDAKSCVSSPYLHLCPQLPNIYMELSACGHSPLPCSQYYDKGLRLRNLSEIGKGFYTKEMD